MKSSRGRVSRLGKKVVSASNMAAYEKLLIQNNLDLSECYMDRAAAGLFEILKSTVLPTRKFCQISLLIGKGNNGGDAYALGAHLLKEGYAVTAYQLFSSVSDLSEKKAKAFEKSGGKRSLVTCGDDVHLSNEHLIIDGLLGTGFAGEVTGLLLDVIKKCNSCKGYVFSIDIPSGVEGDTGIVCGSAIYADMTGYLGALKAGNVFEDGLLRSGELAYVDFGMDMTYLYAESHLIDTDFLAEDLPRREKNDHKYSVGQVCVIAGSDEMPGAGDLACMSAYRSGAGLVKQFYLGSHASTIKEVISSKVSEEKLTLELSKTKSLLIGPGLGRSPDAEKIAAHVFSIKDIPMVVDADALFLMKQPPQNAILTPHKGELLNILRLLKDVSDKEITATAQEYADKNSVTIVYKGMPTVIYSPFSRSIIMISGNPGMATGGSGDVLSGIIASLLAQGALPSVASVLGVYIHGKAGDSAANQFSEASMMASDIINALPSVFLQMQKSI